MTKIKLNFKNSKLNIYFLVYKVVIFYFFFILKNFNYIYDFFLGGNIYNFFGGEILSSTSVNILGYDWEKL